MSIQQLTYCGPSPTMVDGDIVEDVVGNFYVKTAWGPQQVRAQVARSLDAVKALGGGGGGGVTITTIEKNLGSTAHRSGRFTITGSGFITNKPVMITQAVGPYTGKGTRFDEAEMDRITLIGKVRNGTTIDVYWESRYKVRGNYKIDYWGV